MAKQQETLFRERLLEEKPSGIYHYKLPTQAGHGGLKLPFDSVLCCKGIGIAIEWKWEEGKASPHQIIELSLWAKAGGLALLVTGTSVGEVTVEQLDETGDTTDYSCFEAEFWDFLYQRVYEHQNTTESAGRGQRSRSRSKSRR